MPTAAPPPDPLPTHLYKILLRNDFAAVQSAAGQTLPDDAKLPSTPLDESDGFIHLSTQDQVRGVLGRFFTGPDQAEIVLVRLDYTTLVKFAERTKDAKVQWDQAGAGIFAHVYGADLMGEVTRGWREIRRDDEGWERGLKAVEEEGWFVD